MRDETFGSRHETAMEFIFFGWDHLEAANMRRYHFWEIVVIFKSKFFT